MTEARSPLIDRSWFGLLLHSVRVDHLKFVKEKLDEMGVKEEEVAALPANVELLRRQQKVHGVFARLWTVFTVVFYWALIQSIVTTAVQSFGTDIPDFVGTLILILTPIAVPGLAVTGIAKGYLDRDMQNTQIYCLGLIAAHETERRRKAKLEAPASPVA